MHICLKFSLQSVKNIYKYKLQFNFNGIGFVHRPTNAQQKTS